MSGALANSTVQFNTPEEPDKPVGTPVEKPEKPETPVETPVEKPAVKPKPVIKPKKKVVKDVK
ncbi:MAG: hypothetical protein DRQ78_11220 [Epsilonproteobacteria bacterium]|nr:MAG: hypothetical protein DRQ78_11220 [Campylobacterota bacterium]